MPHPSHYPPYLVSLRLRLPSGAGIDPALGSASRLKSVARSDDALRIDLLECTSEAEAVTSARDLVALLPSCGSHDAGMSAEVAIAFLARQRPMASFSVTPDLVQLLGDRAVRVVLFRCSRRPDLARRVDWLHGQAMGFPFPSQPASGRSLLLALRAWADEADIDRARAALIDSNPRAKPPAAGTLTLAAPASDTADELVGRIERMLDQWVANPPVVLGGGIEGQAHIGVLVPGPGTDGAISLPPRLWLRLAEVGLAVRVSFYQSTGPECSQ